MNVDDSTGDNEKLSLQIGYAALCRSDFEQSRQFGPCNGTCCEKRAFTAYQIDQLLEPIHAEAGALEIYVSFGTEGHKK
jgi:hypothetical protein